MAKKGERRQVSITIAGGCKYFRSRTLEEAKAKRDNSPRTSGGDPEKSIRAKR